MDGSVAYKYMKSYIRSSGDGVVSCYNDAFVVNYFTVASTSTWVNFDDVEAIKEKVSYAKKNGLLGYSVFQVGNDDNWVLSTAAYEVNEDHHNRKWLIIVLVTTLTSTVLLGMVICYYHKGTVITITRMMYRLGIHLSAPDEDLNENGSDLIVFDYLTIKLATSYFSKENKVGEGGFGAVYKVTFGNSRVSEIFHAK
ncbi:glycoside hydrolase family 18 protein [Medicago truncatula]|uniref:Glycoside hydrolase family 18 protein n=1 Tax=Medicago truncatula TaxID=3880 RepID=A0A072UDM6_MEDTR|nr:glycoside hydrolase family 18 protein [Medicago truncatula]